MAESYLDRDKLVPWLNAHPPTVKGHPKLILESESDRTISDEYEVVLKAQSAVGGVHQLGLNMPIVVSKLFPHDAYHFTTVELAALAEMGNLDDQYMQRVEEQWNLLRWQLAWETGPPSSFDIGKVKRKEHLATLGCYLQVRGAMPRHLQGVGYATKLYESVTDESFPLGAFLEEKALDEAWNCCWVVGQIRWRQFI